MKVVILAAGQGTRLRPYTERAPKCMVPFLGLPLLHWQFQSLRRCGLAGDILVIGGYQADKIVLDGHKLAINERYAVTNMVETLFTAKEFLSGDEDVLIVYGDIICEPKVFQSMVARHDPVVVAADLAWRSLWQERMEDPLQDAETFKFDASQRISELGRKPKSYGEIQAQYIGLIKIRADVVQQFVSEYETMNRSKSVDGRAFEQMFMTSFLNHLIANGWQLGAALHNGGWLEFDTTSDLEHFERLERRGSLKKFFDVRAVFPSYPVFMN